MTRFVHMITGAILLLLVFNTGIAAASEGEETHTDLNVSKVVSSPGPYTFIEEVTWVVTLTNNGPANATGIMLQEDISQLTGLKNLTTDTDRGEYNTTTNVWSIDELDNATSATLTIKTNFTAAGVKTNRITITGLNETDPVPDNNQAEAGIQINAPDIHPLEQESDLNVSKTVSSAGPYAIDDEVTWAITLRNDGPANATNITLQEDISQLTGLKNITAVSDRGIYNTTTNIWSIDELDNATSATLTIKTNFTAAGVKTNRISITGLNETDPVPGNNQAEAVVQFNTSGSMDEDEPLSANLVIRPTTLNLNSKGVFTVYISLTGATFNTAEGGKKPRVDYASSTLTCGGADMIRASVSAKDGGTLIAKFHRSDLENVTPGEGVKINCSGALVVNGNTVNIQGNDTIRVIGEKKGLDKMLSRLWKFLGIEKDDIEINESEDGNMTVTFSLNPDNFRNSGQIKKILKQDNKSDRGEGNEIAVSEQTQIREENQVKNNGDDKQNREKNTDNKSDKDNKAKDKRNDESAGKSAGKKNT
ncbi:MAG: DUF11 domain-containing protein [Methanoregula sp.]